MQPNDIALQKAIADLDAKWRQRFQEAANDLKLRQWCVEQASKVHSDQELRRTAYEAGGFKILALPDPMELAASMHRFLVEPFAASPPAD